MVRGKLEETKVPQCRYLWFLERQQQQPSDPAFGLPEK